MANTFAPFGLKTVGGVNGAAPTFGANSGPLLIAYNDTNKIFYGDPVKLLATGYIARWTAGTAVSQCIGIFRGCEYFSVSQKKTTFNNYWVGGDVATNAIVKAQVDPISSGVPLQFWVQTADSNTTAVAVGLASIGLNADVAMGSGDTNTGVSTAYLDINTFATTATLPFRIIGAGASSGSPVAGPGSDSSSAYNWVKVQANIYQETGLA
jgi:hypothetical protein